jgi:hypothetical protein
MTHKLLTRLSMRGVLAALLLCIAAFSVAPKIASAQLYVAKYDVATVSEYNAACPIAATSPINVNLITGANPSLRTCVIGQYPLCGELRW